nr:MAG TPA: Repressor protein CI [Caudoviricetes sp.]
MASFATRLKELRTEAKLTQQDLADTIKVSKSTISMYENGKRLPEYETLEAIADYFNVDMDYLTGKSDYEDLHSHAMNVIIRKRDGTVLPYPREKINAIIEKAFLDLYNHADFEEPDFKLTPATDYVNIPVFGAIACGEPIEAFNEVLDYTTIPASWLKGGQEYFCLTAAGDSMEPLVSEGDIAVIRKQPDCENGQICAVFVNGYDATLKKVYKTGRIITLQPVNPAREPQSFEIGGDTDIQIIGVMVELRKRFL